MAKNIGNWFENAKQVLAGVSTGNKSTYVASGAIALSDKVALLDASGATTAMTLAAGTGLLEAGSKISITCIDASNAVTVTLSSALSTSVDVATFTLGDSVEVVWTGANWAFNGGVVIA